MTSSAAHKHGPNCGHTAVLHGDHVDYLDDGHLHHPRDGHVHEHIIEVSDQNPDRGNHDASCGAHRHGPGAAATRLSHTETMSTIWLAAGFTTPTATIAMITGRCLWASGNDAQRHRFKRFFAPQCRPSRLFSAFCRNSKTMEEADERRKRTPFDKAGLTPQKRWLCPENAYF